MATFIEKLQVIDWGSWAVSVLRTAWQNPVQTLILLVSLYIGWKLFWFFLRYFYALKSAKDLVYMQITLPRNDSQKDRERDTEKDFKERIAIMEQFYRALHEIRELNLMNLIKVKLFQHDVVSMELVAQKKQVAFYIVVPKYYQDILEKQVTSYYPDADIQFMPAYSLRTPGAYVHGYYLYQSKPFWNPTKTYKLTENDPLNDMTNVLSKLEDDEQAVVQISIRPRDHKWQKRALEVGTALFKGKKKPGFFSHIPILSTLNTVFISLFMGFEHAKDVESPMGKGDPLVRMLQAQEEEYKKIGEKATQPGFDTVIRIFASSKKKERVDTILNNIVVGFNVFKSSSNWFQSRRIVPLHLVNTPPLYHAFKYRIFRIFEKQSIMVPEELATVFHFPASRYNYTPVIRWLAYKVLPPPVNLPMEGIFLGYNVYRGAKREVHMKRKDRTRHHYIIGQTGTGKSAYLTWMAKQDILNGDGVCVIDPHGDLIEDLTQYVPKERVKDVIVFSPGDKERPMGLNILEAHTSEQQDMASSQATEIFIKIFGDEIFGPRIQHYFRNACLTLMEDQEEGATLIDVPRVFTDDDFMKYKVTKVKNPVVKSFWEHEYAKTGQREREEMIPYFSAKFGPFITNSIMRNTIGQTKSAFDFRKCMDEQKILLINLSKGKIGDLNTQLLGLIMVARIQMAAMSRVDMKEEDRKDFYLYVDEFQNFATDSFCSILSEARKYRLCLIMAHQYINQLVVSQSGKGQSTQIRDAVFGNVGTLQSFKVGAEDAEYLAKEYAPVLSEQDVIGIANYKAYIKLNIDSATSRPFSLETIWDPAQKNAKIGEIVKEYSRMKYGRKRIFVDEEIAARIGIDLGSSASTQPPAKPA